MNAYVIAPGFNSAFIDIRNAESIKNPAVCPTETVNEIINRFDWTGDVLLTTMANEMRAGHDSWQGWDRIFRTWRGQNFGQGSDRVRTGSDRDRTRIGQGTDGIGQGADGIGQDADGIGQDADRTRTGIGQDFGQEKSDLGERRTVKRFTRLIHRIP